jgi:hypothetical protein
MRVSLSGFFLYPLKDGDHKYIERFPSFLIVDVLLNISDIERFPSFLIVDVLLNISDIERFAQGSADRKCRVIAAGN